MTAFVPLFLAFIFVQSLELMFRVQSFLHHFSLNKLISPRVNPIYTICSYLVFSIFPAKYNLGNFFPVITHLIQVVGLTLFIPFEGIIFFWGGAMFRLKMSTGGIFGCLWLQKVIISRLIKCLLPPKCFFYIDYMWLVSLTYLIYNKIRWGNLPGCSMPKQA